MTVRIKLIVTGDMERQALAESLKQIYPSVNSAGQEVIWEKPRKLHCATSHRLSSDPGSPSTQMRQLARAMIDEAIDGKAGVPSDMVIAIDDVEVANMGQEGVIAQHFRMACLIALNEKVSSAQTRNRYCDMLRQRCSFHVLRPMVESYLFADPAALAVSGVMAGINPVLRHPTDVEDFEVTDPLWLPQCRKSNELQRANNPWWRHEYHPKRYLEHLILRSGGPSYDETDQGRRALQRLQWTVIPKAQSDVGFLRALFEDIADFVGVPSPLGPGDLAADFYPARTVDRRGLMLRNQ